MHKLRQLHLLRTSDCSSSLLSARLKPFPAPALPRAVSGDLIHQSVPKQWDAALKALRHWEEDELPAEHPSPHGHAHRLPPEPCPSWDGDTG